MCKVRNFRYYRNNIAKIYKTKKQSDFGMKEHFSLTKSDTCNCLNKVHQVVPLWAGFTGGKKRTVPLFLYLLHPLFKLIFQE